MKKFVLMALPLVALAQHDVHAQSTSAASASAASMIILRSGTQASIKGPAQNFTGTVRVDPLWLQPQSPARTSAAYVTFEPGAHSNWHSHPFGQLLIVTAGAGWIQQEGGPRQEIKAGDVIWTPPGVRHWHGATATTSMTHIAIQESLDGKNTEWFGRVSDQQYLGAGK